MSDERVISLIKRNIVRFKILEPKQLQWPNTHCGVRIFGNVLFSTSISQKTFRKRHETRKRKMKFLLTNEVKLCERKIYKCINVESPELTQLLTKREIRRLSEFLKEFMATTLGRKAEEHLKHSRIRTIM